MNSKPYVGLGEIFGTPPGKKRTTPGLVMPKRPSQKKSNRKSRKGKFGV